jgi:hypothetical protein
VMVRIQCFSFGSRGKTMGQSITERSNGGSELVLTQWEGSVTRCGGMTMSAGGEATPRREKRGNNISWADANLVGLKIKKIYAVDSTGTNKR